jgi:hypothetical protein
MLEFLQAKPTIALRRAEEAVEAQTAELEECTMSCNVAANAADAVDCASQSEDAVEAQTAELEERTVS